ncbi:MAG TPA: rod shape-determining protein MreC, partial [Chromatiaceae bacterium]|nr:rod shape-determining protein MreC [Chromatiaceae bacterium]
MLLSTALMIADHNNHQLQRFRAALSMLMLPIQTLADLPTRASNWFSDTLASRASLLDENHTLHQGNLKLKARLQQFEALQAENMRLRDLLDSSYKIGDRVLIAELVGVDLDPF